MKRNCALFALAVLTAATVMISTSQAQLLTPPTPPGATNAVAKAGGKISFAEPVFDFGRVSVGSPVKHEFKFTNTGTQPLEVTDVRPSCGCTTAGQWSKHVEPGQSGSIPIQFNTANFSGPITKTVSVTCNDPSQPTVVLSIKGTIWKPIEVTPTYAVFNLVGNAPTNETRTVRIVNNLEEPLTVSDLECTNHSFQTELKTVRPGKEFEVVIKTVPPLGPGTTSAQVRLKTSSTNMPVISINALATVQPAVMVYPNQIILPAGPLPASTPYNITVRNNVTNALAVTEPTINAEGVEIQTKEIQPGRYFTLALKFPAGFQVIAGKKVELSFKTSHPQFPSFKVPVYQTARPAQPQVRPLPAASRPAPLIGPPLPPRPPIAAQPPAPAGAVR